MIFLVQNHQKRLNESVVFPGKQSHRSPVVATSSGMAPPSRKKSIKRKEDESLGAMAWAERAMDTFMDTFMDDPDVFLGICENLCVLWLLKEIVGYVFS